MNGKHLSATRILALGFAGIIALGAVLLALPAAARDGEPLSVLNAIFTATSAVCVTGLVVVDTWTQFSLFGQMVLLLLIQVGGLGFMSAVMAILMIARRPIGLSQRWMTAESIGISQLAGVVRLSRRILVGTLLLEGGGAILLSLRFVPRFGFARGCWYALFHAVSAFCNAGFDLMGRLAPGSSLTIFQDDPLVLLTVAFLIIAGGIGFVVWNDIGERRKTGSPLNLHTRVTLASTAVLLALGTGLFLWTERNGVLAGMDFGERLLNGFFQSATPRTAGFNAVDMGALSDGGKALRILLMFIGAAPGGTGGGVKVTTFVVAACAALATQRGRRETTLWHYRLEDKLVYRAFCTMATYCGMALVGSFLLTQEGAFLTDALFECFSAIGTVGLTTGVTPRLGAMGKTVLILLMYAGRVGSLTVFLAFGPKNGGAKLSNPVGKIIVG